MRNYFKGSKQKTFLGLILLVVVLFFLEAAGVMNFVTDPAQKIFRPLQLGFYKTGQDFANFFETVKGVGSLRARENELSAENAKLLAENASLKKLTGENKLLREQLGAKIAAKDVITASVIGGDPFLSSEEFLLDKGEADGVKEDALVVIKDILIGQIGTVRRSTSTVRLLTDPESKIAAITEGGTKGIVEGEFGSGLALKKVAQTDALQEGQVVFTLGEARFPRGLVLGKITKVQKNPAELFQTAVVEPLLPFKSLDLVFIVK
jgi:rod shape-determining protein MreC